MNFSGAGGTRADMMGLVDHFEQQINARSRPLLADCRIREGVCQLEQMRRRQDGIAHRSTETRFTTKR
jgi:hypothetical protein